ncbi:MAG: peptidoglycan-binding protein [Deltaproteobacteria bacterium]|nr:peptidoglycan-binding protein [Deltaproteobacteria bacterium]
MARLNDFDKMWDAYPNPGGTAEEAKHTIGGRAVSALIDNTCVLRLSRAFNYSGNRIPRSSSDEITTIRGGDGLHYALRVREFTRYMKRKYGRPDLEHTYPDPGGGPIPSEFKGRQGVIIFDVRGWADATGHVDLWNGTKCRHNGYFHKASTVMLWSVDDAPVEVLAGSVGAGGRNDSDDVKAVQHLLADAGVNPGAIDGIAGSKTIAAIRKFQGRFLSNPDGRVDPNGRTWRELLEQ